jgi:hypothetical protein
MWSLTPVGGQLIKYEIFSEDITRFYMAEMIMAIKAVHELGFIHRLAVVPPPWQSHSLALTSLQGHQAR